MNIPKYWAKAEQVWPAAEGGGVLRIWRSSNASETDARAAAETRLGEMLREIAEGCSPRRIDYTDRPVREELLGAVEGADALITRNAQGAEVLNTARVMFIDVDFLYFRRDRAISWLAALFGKKSKQTPEERARAQFAQWLTGEPGARVRLYRTRAGLRVLRLDRLFDPAAPETQIMLKAAGADPLYSQLCAVQASFRARLTPKHHRIGMKRIPGEWPCAEPALASARAAWLADYAQRSRGRAACEFLAESGDAPIHPEAEAVLREHDRRALGVPGSPLA